MKMVLSVLEIEPAYRAPLEQALAGYKVIYSSRERAALLGAEILAGAEVIIGNPPGEVLARCKALRWLQLYSAGVDGIAEALPHKDVVVTNATGAYGHAISEVMVGYVFSLFKKLHLYRDQQHKQIWRSAGNVRSVKGATVVVVGLGDIGGQFAQRMKALGATVIGVRRSRGEKPEYVDELVMATELDAVLPRADVVALSVPATGETAGLLSRERLARVKDGAIVINVGRGSAVDTEALCDELANGRLLGAGLDVTDPEPLPPGHRLWSEPNAIVTPHSSGWFYLHETYEYLMEIILENAVKFIGGAPLRNVVDFEKGYASSVLDSEN